MIATDIAGNDSLSRTATVVVNLIDKNDNFPIFSNSVYVATVGEEMLAGSQIINVAVSETNKFAFTCVLDRTISLHYLQCYAVSQCVVIILCLSLNMLKR